LAKKPAPAARKPDDSAELQNAKQQLAPFLKSNPSAYIEEVGKADSKFRLVRKPWGDVSVAFLAGEKAAGPNDDLIKTLNKLYFPERLTAIYHKRRRSLEVLWTAYKLGAEDEAIANRKFDFALGGKIYSCNFGRSSDELLTLAEHAAFLSVSETGFRNLQSFASYIARRDKDPARYGEPLSFHIKGITWKEEQVLDLVRHINFYLRYYDAECPYIVVQPPTDASGKSVKTRYVTGKFPGSISSRRLNQTLMSFWIAAFDEDVTTSFLLHYRILEYVSSYYLQTEQRLALRKLLATPDIGSELDATIDALAGIVREEKGNDIVRFVRMFEELVDSDKIWKQICSSPDTFTSELVLDGGFKLAPIVANVKSKDSFGPKGMENVARAFRQIRNGLAHGGEAQAGRLILPTSENFRKLLAWVHLIEVAAGEVVLFEHLT
jgi:hypothetical protein